MPTLQITRAGMAPEHAMATCNYLLSLMLWPVECDDRTEFLQTCAAAAAIDAARAVPGAAHSPDLIEQALRARRPADFQQVIDRRVQLGLQVGEYYASAWQHTLPEMELPPFVAGEARRLMTSPQRRALHSGVLGEKSLENVLREFRPAACLWAARFILEAENMDHAFPCAPDRIPEFLGLAEWVRRQLSQAGVGRRREPLLPPDADVWRPPAWLNLPRGRLVRA